jgi:hypothetical protein
MDDSNEQKRKNSEKVNFAMQGMTDNAQVTIAVAVGIFGVLAIFVNITQSSVWTKDLITLTAALIILSIAYWALVVLGLSCYIFRRLFEGLLGGYTKIWYPEYESEIREIAKRNKLTHLVLKALWPEREEKFRGIWVLSIFYIVISSSLWFFIVLYPSLRILFNF